MSDLRFKIVRGTDKSLILRITSSKTGTPKDLTNTTNIEVSFNKTNGGKLALHNVNMPATNAQLVIGDVTYTATNTGGTGNLIKLIGNTVKTVSQVIADWNTANSGNQVSSNATSDQLAAIFPSGEYQLTGGYASYAPVAVYGNPVLGAIQVTILEKETQSLKIGSSQSFSVKVDDGVNPSGLRFIGVFENKLDVIDPA